MYFKNKIINNYYRGLSDLNNNDNDNKVTNSYTGGEKR